MTTARFTQRAQLSLIILLLIALVGIGQGFSFTIYKITIVAMVAIGLLQVAVGNIPPDASPARFAKFLGIFVAIIVALFGLSIWLAPVLVDLGR